jgi:hypothetical protein
MEYPLVYVLAGFFLLILFLLHSAVRNSSLFSPSPRSKAARGKLLYHLHYFLSPPRASVRRLGIEKKCARSIVCIYRREQQSWKKNAHARDKKVPAEINSGINHC